MDVIIRNGFISPVVNRGIRKPFGEMTNTPPSKRANHNNPDLQTPSKEGNNDAVTSSTVTLTPMANLKLLMRVAAEKAEIEQQQPRRELFKEEDEENNSLLRRYPSGEFVFSDHDYSGCNSDDVALTPSSVCSSMSSQSSQSSNNKVSRKDKSLGLLCDKFICRFPLAVPAGERCEIPLDDLAKQMSTERRRIYDIVNVLEAVQMMTKVGKNLYAWHGTTHQLMTLAWLRQLAGKLNMLQRYHEVRRLEADETCMSSCSSSSSASYGFLSPRCFDRDLKRSPLSSASASASPASSCSPSPSPVDRKTSLGVACQKFLMLFLILPEAKINLDVAAKVIHGIGLPDAIMKTRIRRLYDIANILQSLKLIQKVQITEMHGGKKPAFQYIGPVLDGIEVSRDLLQTLPLTRQRHSLLTFGKNLLDLPDTEDPQDDVNEVAPFKRRCMLLSQQQQQRSSSLPLERVLLNRRQSPLSPLVQQQQNGENDGQALNLVKKKEGSNSGDFEFAVPCISPTTGGGGSNNNVRHSPTARHMQQQRLLRMQQQQQNPLQQQLFKSPGRPRVLTPLSPMSNGVSLLRRALTDSASSSGNRPAVRFIQLDNGGSTVAHSQSQRVIELLPKTPVAAAAAAPPAHAQQQPPSSSSGAFVRATTM